MLHLNTIDDTVFQLLRTLCSKDYMANFALAGGTSLALHIGHRKSIDIDMFAHRDADFQEISLFLENDFTDITIRRTAPVFIFREINKVKSDFIKHSNNLLIKPCFAEQGIMMFSKEDIGAMKLNAICGRGSKKDFYDIYTLLQIFSLTELLTFYDKKFQSDNSYMALRNLQYFENAENTAQPELLEPFPKWNEIKKFLIKTVNNYKF